MQRPHPRSRVDRRNATHHSDWRAHIITGGKKERKKQRKKKKENKKFRDGGDGDGSDGDGSSPACIVISEVKRNGEKTLKIRTIRKVSL